MTSALQDQLSATLGENYHIDRELTAGAMARVFVAHDRTLARDIVVKALPAELSAVVNRERFRREIQIAGRLHHQRIVPVLAAGESGSLLYYTMPYIQGDTLRAFLSVRGQLSWELAVRLAADVADALAYAHEHNIIHRDIKPDNVLIDHERAMVTDFGIARAIERSSAVESVTSTGFTLGTPTYMSPEQAAADRELDGRSDIYSLGCVLYEMLSGAPPFTGTPRTILVRHIQERPPSLQIARPDIPEHVIAAVERALAKAPADRFASAGEFGDALRAPSSASFAAMRSTGANARRSRLAIGAIAAVIAVLLIGGIGWSMRVRANESARLAALAGVDARRIAVLYLDSPSGDASLAALAHGLTRDLISRLGTVSGLTMISEAGIRRFGEGTSPDSVARVLGVGTVVSGSVEPNGDSIRIDVQIVDPRTLTQTGSVRIAGLRRQSLALRDTLVGEMADQLRYLLGRRIQLVQWQSATSQRAWELRQQAADLVERSAMQGALESGREAGLRRMLADSLLDSASHLDPRWSDPLIARGWLARDRFLSSSVPASNDTLLTLGVQYANAALELGVDDAHALELRGVLRLLRWRIVTRRQDAALADSAEADLLVASRASPAAARAWNALSVLRQDRGDAGGAVDAARQALGADPFLRDVAPSLQRLIFAHLHEGKGDSARALCALAVRRFPSDPALRQCELSVLGWTGAGSEDVARAYGALARAERDSSLPLVHGIWPSGRLFVGAVLARSGNRDAAWRMVMDVRRALAGIPPQSGAPLSEAYVWLLLDRRDSALAVLSRAVQQEPRLRADIGRSPWFVPLASDSVYRALVGAAGR